LDRVCSIATLLTPLKHTYIHPIVSSPVILHFSAGLENEMAAVGNVCCMGVDSAAIKAYPVQAAEASWAYCSLSPCCWERNALSQKDLQIIYPRMSQYFLRVLIEHEYFILIIYEIYIERS